jgi:rhamnulokinase
MNTTVAAVDLGATSGRVILGYVTDGRVHLDHVARFANEPVRTIDGLHWNILELYRNVVLGLQAGARRGDLVSVGVDSWGVDYGLIRRGELAGIPYHYRDARTTKAAGRVLRRISAADLYARTGLQHQPINTIGQLQDDLHSGRLTDVDRVLLTPSSATG